MAASAVPAFVQAVRQRAHALLPVRAAPTPFQVPLNTRQSCRDQQLGLKTGRGFKEKSVRRQAGP